MTFGNCSFGKIKDIIVNMSTMFQPTIKKRKKVCKICIGRSGLRDYLKQMKRRERKMA